ncbi:MAG: hypothetical protein KDC45_14340 [Bacteroidetes bacterium]|nr:hypothetical protein [Bacteroidota bacterium]
MKQIIDDIRFEIREIHADKRTVRKFGIILTIILGLLSFWLFYKSSTYVMGFSIAFALSGFLAAITPMWLYPLYYGLTFLSVIIGYFVSRIILFVIYMLLFAPVGLITRLFRKDLLDQRIDKNASSYWIPKKANEDRKKSSEMMF